MQKVTRAEPKRGGVQSLGQKRAFTAEQVQLIRYCLNQYIADNPEYPLHHRGMRDLALFETALSTCLRAGDLLGLRVEHANGSAFPVKQGKTSKVILARLNTRAQEAIKAWVHKGNLGPTSRLWHLSRREYSDIVKHWAKLAHLDPKHYSTHSMRRTMPAHLYKKTGNVRAAGELLGHQSVANTGLYLGVDTQDAHKLAGEHDI